MGAKTWFYLHGSAFEVQMESKRGSGRGPKRRKITSSKKIASCEGIANSQKSDMLLLNVKFI